MRIRSIHPGFWDSEDIAALNWEQRLIYIGLWSYVDDNGVGRDVPKLIAAELFPLDEDTHGVLASIHGALSEYSSRKMVTRYEVDGRRYLHVAAWDKWQKINRPSKGRYPLPTSENAEISEYSVSAHEIALPGEGEKGRRGEGEKNTSEPSVPRVGAKRGTRLAADWLPAPELRDKMAAECPGLDFRREHDKFVDFWLSKSGANATKLDWGRTWCNWMRTAYERRPTPRPQNTGPNWDELAKRAEARDAAREATAV